MAPRKFVLRVEEQTTAASKAMLCPKGGAHTFRVEPIHVDGTPRRFGVIACFKCGRIVGPVAIK